MTVHHRVSLARASRRTVEVAVEASLPAGTGPQEVVFPVWTPGSYLVREHERHVHDFQAYVDDRPVEVVKTAKNVYRLDAAGGRSLRVTYEVYAHELTVRTNHVDPSHAFLNPVALLPFLPGREGEAQTLELTDLPTGWGAACALPEPRLNTFAANDFDELADSPVECGPHARPEARRRFTVRGVPHEIVLWGRTPLDVARFEADCARIVEAQARLFGGLPYERYVVIAHATDSGRGGLEHRASTALLFPRQSPAKPKGYEDLLSLFSHELFHAWNVKRLKPAAFAPYDLTREALTRQLWAFEGLTSYYEDIFLVRAGLMTRSRWLDIFGERLTELERNPGRLRHSVEEASFDAWIRYYRQDENWNNSSTSYYLKGSLVGALTDLALRRSTHGSRSLDDVLRLAFERYAAKGVGVPEGALVDLVCVVGGEELRPVLERALRSVDELPFDEVLSAHGLERVRRVPVGLDDKGGPAPSGSSLKCDIGVSLKYDGDRVRVSSLRRDSPAEAAGLCPGDELVAIDDLRAETGSALQRLHDRRPGETARLTLFRRDELLTVTVVAGEPRADAWQVREAIGATPEARALGNAWLSPDAT
ncbi:MAG: hypothetical protein RL199_684 [Pseudomonadota bacterium]|jgi:predicted metalloprotease with PDZ domain